MFLFRRWVHTKPLEWQICMSGLLAGAFAMLLYAAGRALYLFGPAPLSGDEYMAFVALSVLVWRFMHGSAILIAHPLAIQRHRLNECECKVAQLQEAHEQASLMADQAKIDANRAAQLKTEFLTNMSHELRTPMHAILGFSRRTIKKFDVMSPEEVLGNVQLIQESGQRLLNLLNELLDLSKLESGKMHFEIKPTDVMTCLERILRETQSLVYDKRINIDVEEPAFSTIAECDNVRIAQVLLNLLSNAIKFTEYGKSVHISFSQIELQRNHDMMRKALCMRIEDEGIGIPEGELGHIFEKFAQSSHSKSCAGGTGLGLAICREIVRAHSGKIWAEHADNGGAIFCFAVPYLQRKTFIERETFT